MTTIGQWLKAGSLVLALAFPLAARAEDPPKVDKKAERVWRANCASCHGVTGKADTEQGQKMGLPDITTADWQKDHPDERIRETLKNGIKREKNGKSQEMESFKDKLKPEQVDLVITYIRSLAH